MSVQDGKDYLYLIGSEINPQSLMALLRYFVFRN